MRPAAKRIILIDPSEETRTVVARRLRAQGYVVEEATDPATGADMALCSPPDAVIADLWMPSISGLQICRLLRSEPATADTPILLCGAIDEPHDRFWAERAGASAYVQKRRTAELVRTLARAIAASRSADSFFFQLGGGTVGIRDRIARHLDAALFDSVIAAEVRALATCGSFERLFDHFAQFLSQVMPYRWLALSIGTEDHFAMHHHPREREAVLGEVRAALGVEAEPFLRIEDEDALDAPAHGQAIVRTIPFGSTVLGRIAVSPRSSVDQDGRSPPNEQLLSHIARELGGPMRMASLVEESQRLASTDGLTGLMTRRAFVSAMEIELARAERHCYPLTVAVLDVDRFKQVNDGHGHAAGDKVLAALGKLLRTTVLRKTDLAARWGGEEFVVAYLSTGKDGAMTAAERLRAAVAALPLVDGQGKPLPVTVSIGLTEVAPGEDLDTVIARADLAMYASKHAGRDRVTLSDPSTREGPAESPSAGVPELTVN